MFGWLFGKKENYGESDEKKELTKEINRLKEEYRAIPNNTTSIDEGLRRFQLSKQIVAVADTISPFLGGGFSGEIICDYNYALKQITQRLWDILIFKKTAYHNEVMALQIKANALLDWRELHYKRWWSDEEEPFQHDRSRADLKNLISEIEKAQVQ